MNETVIQELPSQHQDLKGYLQILWRRKWIILMCVEVAVTVAVLFNELSDPVYEAVATIICQEPKHSILPEMEQPALNRSAMINLIEQLKSRTLAQELVATLPEQITETLGAAASARDHLSQEGVVVGKIQESLSLKMVPGSDSGAEIQQLKQHLLRLETRQASLRMKGARPEQREMISIHREMTRVKEQLIGQLENTASILNDPAYQKRHLLQESITLDVDLETYKAREQELKNILDGYGRDLHGVPKQEVELARLTRERDVNEKIYSMLLEKREELRIAEASKFGQVQLIDAAQEPLAPVKPQKANNLGLGLFLGMSLGVGLVLLMEALDTSLKSPKDVEERVNLPVLAVIPSICPNGAVRPMKGIREASEAYAGRLLSQLEAGSHVFQAYRALQIKFAMVNGNTTLKSILVTSANAAEGKTLTAINMAQAFARNGITTLLVDCDLRRPMIHHILKLDAEPGLSDILRNKNVPIEKVVVKWAIQAPEVENMFILPCGTPTASPYEILDSERMREVLAECERRYDLVILDSPPLMAVTDPIVLGSEVDGVCLVIKSGRTREDTALRAKKLLEGSQTNIIGTILNGIDTRTVKDYEASKYYIS